MNACVSHIRILLLACSLLFSINTLSQTYDFESGLQGWTAGSRAGLNTNSTFSYHETYEIKTILSHKKSA